MQEQVLPQSELINGRFKILGLIGKGGIGTTYRAGDLSNNSTVVLKTLDLHNVRDWKEVELFEREINTLKNLDHPNIPDYYDNFEFIYEGKTFYVLVMEYIEGTNLYNLVKSGKHFIPNEAENILKKLLDILEYIHTIKPSLVHRDINPKNIIQKKDGEIYLVDFGAVGTLVADTVAASKSNTFVGTLGYMPPEQLYGKSLPASDIYALGVTMLYLLSGKEPADFELRNMTLDYSAYLKISGGFKHLLDRMIEPSLEKRIDSAGQALKMLDKQRAAKPKKEKEPDEFVAEVPGQSEIDRIINRKKRKELAAKKKASEKKNRKKQKQEAWEQEQLAKAEASPQRVFINKIEEGHILSVRQLPVLTVIKNTFFRGFIVAIFIFLSGSPLVLPFILELAEEMDVLYIENPMDVGLMAAAVFVLLIIGYQLFVSLLRMKSFHLLLTSKDQVLVYRKKPQKPFAVVDKNQLQLMLYRVSYKPGRSSGKLAKGWKQIKFKIENSELKDTRFKAQDLGRAKEFCKQHKIKYTEYE
ncbi:MAG: serine/threonine protein kinase [Spirochaetales bacterium]|nr:serine/threonine protein kinase [Spirochaetales bacterium]